MRKLNILFLFGLFMAASCGHPANEFMDGAPLHVTQVPEPVTLTPEATSSRIPDMLTVQILDRDHLAIGFRGGDTLLATYNLLSKSFDDVLIGPDTKEKGKGYVGQTAIRTVNGEKYLDAFVMPYKIISFKDGIKVQEYPYDDYLPYSKFETRYAYVTGRGIIAYTENENSSHLYHVNGNDQIEDAWTIFPEPGEKKDDLMCSFYLKPDGTKATFLMEIFDKINVLDIEGGDHFSVTTDPRCPADRKVMRRNAGSSWLNQPSYYRNGFVTDNNIYALYAPVEHCGDAIGEGVRPDLQVFDWSGNMVANYHMGESVYAIAVDEDSGRLYALTWDNKIVTYRL